MTEPIDEATPKSTDERILRSIRQTPRSRRTARHKNKEVPDMLGRVTPKKTPSSNDPTRGGNRLDIKETTSFISDNLLKNGLELKGRIQSFPCKDVLLAIVDHMIATRLGGWKLSEGKYINESGREASLKNWQLGRNGKLIPHGKKQPAEYEIDWLLEAKQYCGQEASN